MSVSQLKDPLAQQQSPDRVFYATGVLLAAEDFRAEQTYHRGRLARVLEYLHGSGTVAGLNVPDIAAVANPDDEELVVEPGVAIDRLGRLIEVPRKACIRLNRWYKQQDPGDLHQGFHATGVVVDLFIRFVECERGKTPAFGAGPFDALDAVTPSRLRDGYQLELVIRKEAAPNLPQDPWPDLAAVAPAARRKALDDAIFAAWREGSDQWTPDGLKPAREHVPNQDPASLFLARLTLPATDGSPPVRTPGAAAQIDRYSRLFVYTPNALARWIGV
jgi:hypothetical protein